MKKEIIVVTHYANDEMFSREELIEACRVSHEFIQALIEHDILTPHEKSADELLFDMLQLQRAKRAARLQRDLEVNIQGIALIFDLLDELEDLRARAELFDKHYK